MRYTQSVPEDTSSSSRVFSSTEVSGLWDEHSIETNLPYRDVLMDDPSLGGLHIVADREWLVGIAMTSVREFCVCALKPFRYEAAAHNTRQQVEGSFVRLTVHHLA
jgi:hypothetical protein